MKTIKHLRGAQPKISRPLLPPSLSSPLLLPSSQALCLLLVSLPPPAPHPPSYLEVCSLPQPVKIQLQSGSCGGTGCGGQGDRICQRMLEHQVCSAGTQRVPCRSRCGVRGMGGGEEMEVGGAAARNANNAFCRTTGARAYFLIPERGLSNRARPRKKGPSKKCVHMLRHDNFTPRPCLSERAASKEIRHSLFIYLILFAPQRIC